MKDRISKLNMGFALMAIIACDGWMNAHAEPAPVFAAPPSPETLAALLIPPRYRSAQMQTSVAPPSTQDGFGMMINFAYNSADIQPESLPLLESVGQMLHLPRVADKVVLIAGHADASGTHGYNQALSERRATTIKQYLVESFGVAPQRLMTIGFGESALYNPADPYADVNRRVQFSEATGISIQ